MNKKHLSVVMAGAMLASSVAPVLAAETTTEVSKGKLGILMDKLETLMESKKYHASDEEAGKSVYRFEVLGKDGKDVDLKTATAKTYKVTDKKSLKLYDNAEVLKELNFKSSEYYTVNVYELGNIERNGEFFSKDKTTAVELKYNTQDFADLVSDVKAYNEKKESDKITKYPGLKIAIDNGWITALSINENESEVTVTLASKNSEGKFNTIKCSVGSSKLTFANPVDEKGNVITNAGKEYIQANIAGFEVAKKESPDKEESIAGKKAVLKDTYKIVNGDINYTVKVDDLYDGFMLTEQGHQLMNKIKEYRHDENPMTKAAIEEFKNDKDHSNGVERFFNITITDENNTKHIIKVVGDSLHVGRINTLNTWLRNEKANVELLAGSNRYATAVEIADTYLTNGQYSNGWKQNRELVLVNGEALVDGLAAAPYAKTVGAPILLTSENNLPKETKVYMRKLISKLSIENLNNKDITVTIVGGEAVVSHSVVEQLRDLGFKVKRISGDNREQTSLAVADKLAAKKGMDKAFVIGAEGEADAMSIAAHAAKKGNPIIVSKSAKGLSTVGLNEVSDYDKVEIIGGEKSVPKATEEALKELIDNKSNVTRLNGKDRFETNAMVIGKYHKGFKNVLIAKDGQRKKSELVDALPAAIFASDNGSNAPAAPIVLATNKISEEQLNQLVLNTEKGKGRTVYQIGNGVARSVMEKIVSRLGLNN